MSSTKPFGIPHLGDRLPSPQLLTAPHLPSPPWLYFLARIIIIYTYLFHCITLWAPWELGQNFIHLCISQSPRPGLKHLWKERVRDGSGSHHSYASIPLTEGGQIKPHSKEGTTCNFHLVHLRWPRVQGSSYLNKAGIYEGGLAHWLSRYKQTEMSVSLWESTALLCMSIRVSGPLPRQMRNFHPWPIIITKTDCEILLSGSEKAQFVHTPKQTD